MEVRGSTKREKETTTITNYNNRIIIEINAVYGLIYEYIEKWNRMIRMRKMKNIKILLNI